MLLNGNFLLRRLWLGEGLLKKRMFCDGSGALTSSQIAFNLLSGLVNPEWSKKGLMTRNYENVKHQREEHISQIIDEAKKDFPKEATMIDVDGRVYVDVMFYEKTKIDNWFEKWFGDSS